MKPKILLLLLLLSPLTFFLSPCYAQVPQGFNYQAIARDAVTGNPITDPVNVRIAILSDDDPETVIWEEEHSDVDPDDHGLFSIVVGQGACLTDPTYFTDIDWTISPMYIRTQIYYGGGWRNLGSSQLWSVPYAMQSKSSEQWTTNGANIYRPAGNVGIGISNPIRTIHSFSPSGSNELIMEVADGLANYKKWNYYVTGGTGNAQNSYLRILNDAGTASTINVMTWLSSGNVGIGTTNPVTRLHVKSNASIATLEGVDHAYLAWYPQSLVSGRKAWMGFGGAGTTVFSIANENTSGGHILLTPGTGGGVAVGTATPTGRMVIQTPAGWDDNTPLFEVRNKANVPVLAVYNNGVRILVDHTYGKGPKGGFAIGGYDYTKAGNTVNLMTVTPDSIRFNINNDDAKGPKGGFAIGGFDVTAKGSINQDFMFITPQQSSYGAFNTFLGYQAGYANTSGTNNVFIGYKAGNTNEIGGNNVFVGNEAGSIRTAGNANVYIGYQAGMRNNGGNSNVIIGHEAGPSAGAGYTNVMIGYRSGYRIANGHTNVFIGQRSGYATTTGQRNTIIGAYAGYNGSDLLKESTGNYNTILGQEAATLWTTGGGNTILGSNACETLTTGNNNTIIGRAAGTNSISSGDNNTIIGYGAQVPTVNGSNQIRLGNTSVTYAGIQVDWSITSDIKWKESINDLTLGLNVVNNLRPVDYIRKNNNLRTREAGFIAQDVEELFNELGIENAGLLSKGYDGSLELRYNDFIPILTKAIQEQQSQIESQNQENQQLKSELESLKERMASIEERLGKD